jgi:hypothetical protein
MHWMKPPIFLPRIFLSVLLAGCGAKPEHEYEKGGHRTKRRESFQAQGGVSAELRSSAA